MSLRSLMPGIHTTKRNKSHKVYPYFLRELEIDRSNQIWATDITYIPMEKGFMYLTAIIDIYSPYIVGWSLSNSMDAEWCTQTLKDAVDEHGHPEIVNTDQGSQYTSEVFSGYVMSNEDGMKLSMDGKGRATDNAFIESLWKNLKYEKVYLNPPEDAIDLKKVYSFYPIPDGLTKEESILIIGGECNIWSEHVLDEKTLTPRSFQECWQWRRYCGQTQLVAILMSL